jgi:LacI family transcriptional regulator
MARSPRITLHHVAAKAGVSIATVSRALNGLTVAPENLERVQKAAAELGYVPNEAARSLRSDRTLALGLIFYELSTARGLELLDALSATVEAAGYSLLISTARSDADNYDVLMRRFLERRVDGLFCIHPRGEGQSLQRYAAAQVPVLAVSSRVPAFAELPFIEPSMLEAAQACAVDMLRDGNTHLAWLDDGQTLVPAPGPTAAWDTGPFTFEPITVDDYRDMDELLAKLMSQKARPQVVTGFESSATAFLSACQRAGVAVPGQFGVVSVRTLGDEHRDKAKHLSSMVLDAAKVGQAAGAAMLQWLAGEPPPPVTRIEVGSWEPRETTGPASS